MTALLAPLVLVALCTLGTGCCTGSTHQRGSRATSGSERAGEVLHGEVSYYAQSLAGRRTANGERYNPRALTAASRTLPFGTKLRVTRLDTGKSVVVRVNDRGPFGHRRRILDLSRAAAEELDMIDAGLVEVEAEVIE